MRLTVGRQKGFTETQQSIDHTTLRSSAVFTAAIIPEARQELFLLFFPPLLMVSITYTGERGVMRHHHLRYGIRVPAAATGIFDLFFRHKHNIHETHPMCIYENK